MATRGTAIIIEKDVINAGPEFNGDMYPHGYGNHFMNELSKVNNLSEFNKFNHNFNLDYFDYSKSSIRNEKYTHSELENNDNIVSMEYICRYVTSDWVFVKNLMSKSVRIEIFEPYGNIKRNIMVRPGEVIRVNSGVFPDNGKGHRVRI